MLEPTKIFAVVLGLCLLAGSAFEVSARNPQPNGQGVNDALPAPDGAPADLSKTVQVFILMGQSNMLEMGKVAGDQGGTLEYAVKTEGLYPFLVDDAGKWTTRQDVRNVAVMGSGGPGKTRVRVNNWLTVSGGKIGVELGIGHHLGNALEEPVLILKSAIGNRSLGWELLPPGSPSYEFTDPKDGKTYVYPGYGQSPDRWEQGTEPKPIAWKAGLQYDGDVARAKEVLDNLGKYYPGATKYEVVGFFWWQGDIRPPTAPRTPELGRYRLHAPAEHGQQLQCSLRRQRQDLHERRPEHGRLCIASGVSSEAFLNGTTLPWSPIGSADAMALAGLLCQRRDDPNVPIEVVARAMKELVQAAKVRHLGCLCSIAERKGAAPAPIGVLVP